MKSPEFSMIISYGIDYRFPSLIEFIKDKFKFELKSYKVPFLLGRYFGNKPKIAIYLLSINEASICSKKAIRKQGYEISHEDIITNYLGSTISHEYMHHAFKELNIKLNNEQEELAIRSLER